VTTPSEKSALPLQVRQDWQRHDRTGLHEAVLASGKTLEQLQTLLAMAQQDQHSLLFTRIDQAIAGQLKITTGAFDHDPVSRTAIYQARPSPLLQQAAVAVVTGGSSDLPVAREAVRTLQFHGIEALEIYDVGVAGLWRIQEQLPLLLEQKVIIAVAGMDAALPTVLGGLIKGLIIAVPSSTGYGRAREGETALNALLCSCAQGLVVVNIDNGFGAACAALRVLAGKVADPAS